MIIKHQRTSPDALLAHLLSAPAEKELMLLAIKARCEFAHLIRGP